MVTVIKMAASRLFSRSSVFLAKTPWMQPMRMLSLHEYISQDLMCKHGVNVPKGEVASSPNQAKDIAMRLGGSQAVIKAQVLAGGRGKGEFSSGLKGGVRVANSADEIMMLARDMIGHRLFTKQTGTTGRPCNQVLVCEKVDIKKEFYFAIVMDRAFKGPVIVASSEGGVNIEEIAASNPNAIIREPIDIFEEISFEQAKSVASKIGFSDSCVDQAATQMMSLYKFLIEKDVTMLEINPMVETVDSQVMCMDAKINFDDNAEYRQKDVFNLRDWSQEDPRDADAAQAGINYIGLDGSIGCMVNGAGLAMATMDLIKFHGGSPANFLDIGGGASAKEVMDGFKILSCDPKVKAILINVFGGIIRCDMIAKGITAAATELNLKVPLVVRLQGNNQKKAKTIIEGCQHKMIAMEDFNDAAKTAVNIAKISELASNAGISVEFSSL